MVCVNQRRAIIAIEEDAPGERTFNGVLRLGGSRAAVES
jgi:hypothetical protein